MQLERTTSSMKAEAQMEESLLVLHERFGDNRLMCREYNTFKQHLN